MSKAYPKILTRGFYNSLVHARADLGPPQSQMAEKLAMGNCSPTNLHHGKNCCNLICCCSDLLEVLGDLKNAIEAKDNRAA